MPTSPLYTKYHAVWDDNPPSTATPILAAALDTFESGIWGGYYNTLHQAETAGDVAAVFRGEAGQAADLAQFRKSDDTILARFTKDGALSVELGLASAIASTFKGAAAQSGDLSQWQNSAGAVLARATKDGAFSLEMAAPAAVPLTLRGAAAQSADLLQFQKSDATVLSRFTKDGVLSINPALASAVPLTLKGAAAQSGNMLEVQDSTAAVLESIDKDGLLTIGAVNKAAYLRIVSGPAVPRNTSGTQAAGVDAVHLNQYGDLICGSAAIAAGWNSLTPHGTIVDTAVFDFAYLAADQRIYSRSLVLREIADSVDLSIGRAGGANQQSSPLGLTTADAAIGSLYWTPALATAAGGGMTKWGARGRATANIAAYIREAGLYNFGGDGKERTGGDLVMNTYPVYTDFAAYGLNYATEDIGDYKHLVVTHQGIVGVFGFGITDYTNYTDSGKMSPGDLFVQGGLMLLERSTPPTPPADTAILYTKDNGGSTQLRVRYANGNDNLLNSE